MIDPERARVVLMDALDLIKEADSWCETDLARDSMGRSCLPDDEQASQWCAVGAIYHAADEPLEAEEVWEYLRAMGIEPDSTNDSSGHEATVEMFRHAVLVMSDTDDDDLIEMAEASRVA